MPEDDRNNPTVVQVRFIPVHIIEEQIRFNTEISPDEAKRLVVQWRASIIEDLIHPNDVHRQ